MSQFQDYLTNPDYISGLNAIREHDISAREMGIVYVEDLSDLTFWEKFINRYFPDKYHFQTATQNTQGKRKLERFYNTANIKALIAIDGDYDYLDSGFNPHHAFNTNQYILHTYSFSRESVLAEATQLQSFFKKCKFSIAHQVNMVAFLQMFSQWVWYGLVRFVIAKNSDEYQNYIESEFHQCFHLTNKKIITECLTIDFSLLDEVETAVRDFFGDDQFAEADLSNTADVLTELGISKTNAYRFISGHTIDKLIKHIHKDMLNQLESKEIEKIKHSHANDNGINEEISEKQSQMIGERISQMKKTLKPKSNIDTFFNLYPIDENDEIHEKILERIQSLHAKV